MKLKLATFSILAVLAGLFALPAQAQIICSTSGSFTYCDNGAGQSSIQSDLGHGRGVIIDSTTGTTTPYTVIQPTPNAPAPVFIPQRAPRPRVSEAPTYTPPVYSTPSAPLGYQAPPPSGYQAPLPYPGGMGE